MFRIRINFNLDPDSDPGFLLTGFGSGFRIQSKINLRKNAVFIIKKISEFFKYQVFIHSRNYTCQFILFFIELYQEFHEKFSFTHKKSVNINEHLDPDLDSPIRIRIPDPGSEMNSDPTGSGSGFGSGS